ncbi:glycosyltransferase family 2 protein [Nesterenkonia flava]|uniref:Glycosyltransferase family 2 protein n=1 Tax=Nesterenkonia flava TaxID=469799 RepID=A0ABU1FSP7_9MICC|nr:glycosyltransferase family 2 protein [Nesterenkonia flava]MDR5711687.1 glycosyltransferase family 2 protein [Nesterenkonia flava]
MSGTPEVSIIVPAWNNEAEVGAALESCLAQTRRTLEVVAVDDGSTDATAEVIRRYQGQDSRIRLLSHPSNRSPFQARRTGVFAARAPYVLFLDGDDELAPSAAEVTLEKSWREGSDLVGFAAEVLTPTGTRDSSFEARMTPRHETLVGDAIVPGLFPPVRPVQMQLWRALYKTELLRWAYTRMPATLELYRADDLPILFFASAAARLYTSVPDRLYRYHFQRGGSGQRVESVDQFDFYLSSLDALEYMTPAVDRLAAGTHAGSMDLRRSYEAARLTVIGNLLKYLPGTERSDLAERCLARLHARVSEQDTVRAAAQNGSRTGEPSGQLILDSP